MDRRQTCVQVDARRSCGEESLDAEAAASRSLDELHDRSHRYENEALPSLPRQKRFIIENRRILSEKNRKTIYNTLKLSCKHLVQERPDRTGFSINLDRCPPEMVTTIYYIVLARRTFLDKPADESSVLEA